MPRRKATPVEGSAEPVQQAFDFQKSFQKLKPDSFWPFIRDYPSWEAAAVYLYRLWPVIDRKLAGHDDKYIDVFTEPITEEDILRKHGNGKYLLHFNDSNRPKGLANMASTKVEIRDPTYEPVVPLEEIVEGADANKSYIEGLKARGKWKENPVPQSDNGQATAELARTLNNVVERITERPAAAAEPPRQDPFDIALRITGLLQQNQPKPAADPYDTALKIVQLMQPPAKPAREVDPLEVYGKVADIIEARASRYAGGGSGGTDWGSLAMEFVKALPMLVQGFTMMRAAQSQAGGVPVAPVAYPMPAAAPPLQAMPVELKGDPFMPHAVPDLSALFTELKPFLLKSMMQGQSGDEFASGLVTFYGEERYQQLAANGQDGLLNGLKGHAELWMMLAPYEEQVRTFIQEFLDYGKAEPETPAGEAA